MKQLISVTALVLGASLALLTVASAMVAGGPVQEAAPPPKELPVEIILAKDGKLGQVKFNHQNHATKNYNISGTGPIACVECHHTAQPASEVVKHPPLKTAFPADRTTTLTEALLKQGPADVGPIACRNCHAKAGQKPITLPEIPQIKHEDSAAMLNLTNQLAFHRNCANCHEEVAKNRQDTKAPQPQKCKACHMK